MSNPFVKNGILYGITSILVTLVIWLVAKDFFASMWLSLLMILVPIFFMVKAVREVRAENGGHIPFGSSFINGLGTIFVGALVGSIFTYLLYNFIDPGLEEYIKNALVENLGSYEEMMGEDAFDQMIEGVEGQSFSDIGTLFKNLFFVLIPGSIISLIIAAIMKKDEPALGLDSNV